MRNVIRDRERGAFAIWLLACPAWLAVAIFVLSRFDQFHGTWVEGGVLATLLMSPFVGVAGILRLMRSPLPTRLLAAAVYLLAGLVLALLAAIFVGCSWAGACF